jgi:hypothetical protein
VKPWEKVHNFGAFSDRFAYVRKEVLRVPLRELTAAVNRHLPPRAQVSISTVNNYEGRGGLKGREPRAGFLAALKHAYPQISLEWLVLGLGKAVETAGEQVQFRRLGALQALGRLSNELLSSDRFADLPQPARDVVLRFVTDVRTSGDPYSTVDEITIPSLAAPGPQETPWSDFLAVLEGILRSPFDAPDHFATQHSLSEEETTVYALTMIAALRPLVVSLRRRRQRS